MYPTWWESLAARCTRMINVLPTACPFFILLAQNCGPTHLPISATDTTGSSISCRASRGPISLKSWISQTFTSSSCAISRRAPSTLTSLQTCQITSLLAALTNTTPIATLPRRCKRGGVEGKSSGLVGGVVGAAISRADKYGLSNETDVFHVSAHDVTQA